MTRTEVMKVPTKPDRETPSTYSSHIQRFNKETKNEPKPDLE